MPQMGLEVTEATVVALHVEAGARVAAGDPLLEVETDKALTDVVAPRDGVVDGFAVAVGDTVPVGAPLVRLGEGGAETTGNGELAVGPPAAGVAPAPPEAGTTAVAVEDRPSRLRAAPVARRAAAQLGIALDSVAGTGPRGRITLRDIERAAGAGAEGEGTAFEPLSATRQAIARRMTASQLIPQFTLRREIDASWLLDEKQRLSAIAGLSLNDLLIQALAHAVALHPALAFAYVEGDGPGLRRSGGVDVGLAVATERGLLVPVLRRVDTLKLGALAAERGRLVGAARAGRLQREEMSGATVSLSNLAAFGVDSFDAMLNPGETAILSVGRTVDRVVPRERALAIVPTLALTLTIDHRAADGAAGGAALSALAELLEGAMEWRA